MIVRTSKENREIVASLSRKLSLGSENHIARIAFAYSLSKEKLNLLDIKNSSGKEYSKSVFFGDNFELYVGLISVKYNLHSSDKDIPRYIKMHVDDGLEKLNKLFENNTHHDILKLVKNEA
jgi:DNA sulfur modification protein DndE